MKVLDYLQRSGLGQVYFSREDQGDLVDYLAELAQDLVEQEGVAIALKAELIHDTANHLIEQAMTDPRLGRNVARSKKYVDQVAGFVAGNQAAVQCLIEILATDYSLYSHSVNVCLLTIAFADFLGLSNKEVTDLGEGGLFHDIGKRTISSAVLNKPAKLTEEEWRIMREHPLRGFLTLRDLPSFSAPALKMVRSHHENLDGSGYPDGLVDEALDLSLRIIRVVDAYDAITSDRKHRGALKPLEGIQIMAREMAKQVDPDVLRSFIRFLGYAGQQAGRHPRPVPSVTALLLGADDRSAID
ncbi:MAG: HD-GYP domain-containing protein [Proteobacteria bacterium]|nr:HD-GYP domain-containing protein [Pseudomonadota bacterium]